MYVYKHKFRTSKVGDNILDRNFITDRPLQKICMDITYIPVGGKSRKFLYLNAGKDLFNGEIVAYDISITFNK